MVSMPTGYPTNAHWWGNLGDRNHLKKFSMKSVKVKTYFNLQNTLFLLKTTEV